MTDKYSSGLYDVYKKLLLPFEGKDISLLEIGVTHESLMMFEKILPLARVYGFDRNPPGLNRDSKAIIEGIDQSDGNAIEDFAIRCGGFDIVIDDGCHFTLETSNCFDALWKHTRQFYVIEDWGIGIATDLAYYRDNKARVRGMINLVLDIGEKNKSRLVLNSKHSYAVFYKGNK